MSRTDLRLPRPTRLLRGIGVVALIGVGASSIERSGLGAVTGASQGFITLPEAQTSASPGGPVVSATVSPDGTFIAFVRSNELAVRDLPTGETRVLTKRPEGDLNYDYVAADPRPSPDSLSVAYVWGPEIRVVAARGGEPTVVLADIEKRAWGLGLLDWFPDGKSLLVSLRDFPDPRQLVRVTIADGKIGRLRSDWSGEQGSVSPDGRHILFEHARPRSQNKAVFVMSADGTGELALADDPTADDGVLGWFPDGKRVLFVRNRGGANDALALPIEDGRPTGRLTVVRPDVGRVRAHGVTRDGLWYISRALSWPSVFVADLDTQSGKALSAPTPVPGHPWLEHSLRVSWSPSGDRLAYTVGWPNANAEVVVQQIPIGGITRHAPSLTSLDRVAWSPDGRHVVVEGTANGQPGLFQLDITTEEANPKRLVAGASPFNPILSPDGRTLFYRARGREGVVKKDLESGAEEIIPVQGGQAGTYLSPDGQAFLLLRRPRPTAPLSIGTMPVQGGRQRTVIADLKESGNAAGWSHDGKYVLFHSGDSIMRVSISGGAAEPIGLTLPNIRSFSVHPNGRKIALTGGDVRFAMEAWQFGRSGAK